MGRPKRNINTVTPDTVEAMELYPFNDGVIHVYADQDIELSSGRHVVATKQTMPQGMNGIVVSTTDIAQNGVPVENGIRIPESFIIASVCKECEPISVTLFVNEGVNILSADNFGTRVKRGHLLKGTHIADVVLVPTRLETRL